MFNQILAQYLSDIDNFKITIVNGSFYFEGNGMHYDGSNMSAEEAFINAVTWLKAPKIIKWQGIQ